MGSSWVVLEPSWDRLGSSWSPSWGHLGQSWGRLGPSDPEKYEKMRGQGLDTFLIHFLISFWRFLGVVLKSFLTPKRRQKLDFFVKVPAES
jgi:hypothetical protein